MDAPVEELERLDAKGLRNKLLEAERKYYDNLHLLQDKLDKLNSVQTLNKFLASGSDYNEAVNKLVEISVSDMGVEKALFLEPDENGYKITSLKGYSRRKESELKKVFINSESPQLSLVTKEQKGILFEKPEGDFCEVLDLCQMIILPVCTEAGNLFGVYIVGFSEKKMSFFRKFQEKDIGFFNMIGSQVSSTLQSLALRNTFKKFVPRQFLDRLSSEGVENIKLGHADTGIVSILFSDIRSFTTLSEMIQPQELLNFLNSYFERMNAPIHDNNGFIDKFIGDAIMALFADNDPSEGAKSALLAAIEMMRALKLYNQDRRKVGYAPISIGIGIHSGDVIIGTVGSTDRMDSTVLGNTVNLASRIEALTKFYNTQIIISSQTYRYIEKDPTFLCRELDFLKVKGKVQPEIVYEVFNGNPEDIFNLKRDINGPYHEGLVHFHNRSWKKALELFGKCLHIYPDDGVSQAYFDRCQKFLVSPPPLEWDGILEMTHK